MILRQSVVLLSGLCLRVSPVSNSYYFLSQTLFEVVGKGSVCDMFDRGTPYTFHMKASTYFPYSVMIRKILAVLFLAALSVVLSYRACTAQSDEEMQILQMFFKDKDIFSSATRHPKPVSQIAENVTVVTDKEIEAMNAHTVAEVLNRVNGSFVDFSQGIGNPGSASLLHIQGSEERHVLVVVDGVPWNSMASGAAETNTIPVGIINRIEIIKGPGSSSWGSSLGGVVHIITKSPGHTAMPKGKVQGSYGENSTQDYRAELTGNAGKLGYYLFGGRQYTEGFGAGRDFEGNSFFSKFSCPVSTGIDLGLSIGYSQPDIGLGVFPQLDVTSTGKEHNFWGTASLDASLPEDLALSLRLFTLRQKSIIANEVLGLGFPGTEGELFQKTVYDEKTTGGTARLVWKKDAHTAVLGAEFNDGNLDQTIDSGRFFQYMGAPSSFQTEPEVEKWAVYFNDTIVIGRFSITPGIRFDSNSITESFVSPSLGLTYRLGNETILRGSVARGFTSPPLSWVSGGALFLDPNAALKNERVWSYQIGAETAALRYCWLKGSLFRHEVEDIFQREFYVGAPPTFNDLIVNGGESIRQGFELEAESVPFWNLTLRASFAYVNLQPENSIGSSDIYACNIALAYRNDRIFNAELFGHYIWWDAEAYPEAQFDDFVWDLNLNRKLYAVKKATTEMFLTAHNLFNGSQYQSEDLKNPGRWVEAGIRVKF